MKKLVAYFISALIGLCLGVIVHCTFMLVQAEGCMMLPIIEPDQYVLINLLDKDVREGDVVALKAPYYTLDGEGNIIFRRVESSDGEYLSLSCDTKMVKENHMKILGEDILGKVVYPKVE